MGASLECPTGNRPFTLADADEPTTAYVRPPGDDTIAKAPFAAPESDRQPVLGTPAARPRRRWHTYVLGLLLVTALVNLGLWLVSSETQPFGSLQRLSSTTRQTARAFLQRFSERPAIGRPTGARIDLNVTVEPPQAKLFLDGRVASNPIRVAYPADDAPHELRAEASGYATRVQTIKLDRDLIVVLSLAVAPVNDQPVPH